MSLTLIPKPKPKPNPSQASVGSVEAARAVPLLVALCGTASEMPREVRVRVRVRARARAREPLTLT